MKNKPIVNYEQSWNASDYNDYATAQYEIALKALKSLTFKGDESVLDIGCGDGAISYFIAKNYTPNGKVLGIDLSTDMINLAKKSYKNENLKYKNVSAIDIALSNKIDLVTSFYC